MSTGEDGTPDPFQDWRANPFFVLELTPGAGAVEIERTGAKWLGLLAAGGTRAKEYATPFGPAVRDEQAVRRALVELRDPHSRIVHELLYLPRR